MVRTLARSLITPRARLRLYLAAMRVRGTVYRGRTVACPLCGGHFRRFLPFGSGSDRRDQAECPACHALERTRLLGLYLEREEGLLNRRAGDRSVSVLHFAPEPSIQRRLRGEPTLAYRSADLTWPLADDRVDIHDLPYATASFEYILCSHVLAHVEDDRKALAQLRRVLTPNGVLILQSGLFPGPSIEAPAGASSAQRAALLGQADRWRNYGDDHDSRVAAAGFEVRSLDYAASFSPEQRRRFGLDGAGLITRCVRVG